MGIGSVRLWKGIVIGANLSASPVRGLVYEPQPGNGQEAEEKLSAQISGQLEALDNFAEHVDEVLTAAEEGVSECYVDVQVLEDVWWRSRLYRGRCRRRISDRARGAAGFEVEWVRADWWEGPAAENLAATVYNYKDATHANQILVSPLVDGGMLTPLSFVGEFRQAGDGLAVVWIGADTGRVNTDLPDIWVEAESLEYAFYGKATAVSSSSYSGGTALSVTATAAEAVFAGGTLAADFLVKCAGRHYKLLAGVRAKTVNGTVRAVVRDGSVTVQEGPLVTLANKGVVDLGDFRLGDPALVSVAAPPKVLQLDLKAGGSAAFVVDWLLWMPVDEGFIRLGTEGVAVGTTIKLIIDRESGKAFAESTTTGQRARLAPLGVGLRLDPAKYSRLTFVCEDSSRNLGLNMGFDGAVVSWRPRRRML